MSVMGPSLSNMPQDAAISTPTDFATALLQTLGFPTTPSNIQFIVSWAAAEGGNWNNTAHFNPLNTTLTEPGSSSMNSVGVQSFTSWQQGIEATVATLQAYPQVMSALQAGNAMEVDQSGGMAQDLSRWSGGGYTQIGANTGYGSKTGGPASGQTTGFVSGDNATSNSAQAPTAGNPQVPGLNDIPALDAYIRANFGTDAWLLDIPDVKNTLETAVAKQESPGQIQAAIMQTQWWKTTSQAVKNYEQDKANNPGDYSFTTSGSKASQMLAQIMDTAGQIGVQLDQPTAQTLAQNALQFGWTSQQIHQAIGSRVQTGNLGYSNAGGITQQLNAMAGQYYMTLTPQALQSWAQNIAAGTQTLQQFQQQMQSDASLKWTGFGQQLQAGNTMVQLTDSLRNEAAKTMEVEPTSIDFVKNPVYSKILDYVPPDSPNGVHRVMTLSEMDQYLKSQPQWGYTQQARDSAASLAQTLATTWGKVAS